MQSISLKSVLIPSLAGLMIGLYFLGQGLSESENPRDLGDNAAFGKEMALHSHDSYQAKMLLEEALKFKSQPKKEITYNLYTSGGRDWTEKVYRETLENGERFERRETYHLTQEGEKLFRTNILNRDGYWEIIGDGLIKLNYRKSPRKHDVNYTAIQRQLVRPLNAIESEFRYEMESNVEFNGFDCIRVAKIEQNKSEGKLIRTDKNISKKTIYYIDSLSNYIVGEERYSADSKLIWERNIVDFEVDAVFGPETFIVDKDYVTLIADSRKEHQEISRALLLSNYFSN